MYNVLTIGKSNKLVALTGMVGNSGPTTSPTIDIRALLDPYT